MQSFPSVAHSLVRAGLAGLLLATLGAPAIFAQPTTASATWYVDAAAGSDSNDCMTPATACLSVATAVARAGAGDTIRLAPGTYPANLELLTPLTLMGAGADQTFLDGGAAQRVVIAAADTITLAGLTVRNGRANGVNGGGIFNVGTLVLNEVRVVDNHAQGGSGGGIHNSGSLTLSASIVEGNSSDTAGGGISTWYNSSTNISLSRVSENTAHHGGGLDNLGSLTMSDSTVADNRATTYSGGGLNLTDGDAVLERVTFSGNKAAAHGGAINNQLGTLSLLNSTLSGNSAVQFGGLSSEHPDAETSVRSSTIAFNSASGAGTQTGGVGIVDGSISFQGSIVAANSGENCRIGGRWASDGHNLSSDFSCGFSSAGDRPGAAAGLAPLAVSNGSLTAMHGLLPGSLAIDAGDPATCPPTDQRGVLRPIDGDGDGAALCDIGAFEVRQQLAVGDVTVDEGDGGSVVAQFSVRLAPPSAQTVSVDYHTIDGTAVAGADYSAVSGSLSFAPGQTEQVVSVPIIGDADDEPDRSFALVLSNASGADIIDDQGLATIVDDDGLPSLSIADTSIVEGNSGLSIAELIVSLSPAAVTPVSVKFNTLDGTADAGADYVAASGTVTFAAGETTALIEISIRSDRVDEGEEESFSVRLAAPPNANLSDGSAEVRIRDDDNATVGLQTGPAVYEGLSGSRTAEFLVTLSGPAAFPISVDYATVSASGPGAATPGVDYRPASGTLHFAPGQTSQKVAVTIFGDTDDEPDEQFELMLRNAVPVPIYANLSIATILNGAATNEKAGGRVYLPLLARP